MSDPEFDQPDFDLDDDTLRRSGSMKWTYPGPSVLPAWVAELDVAPCPAVARALHDAVDRGAFGYPTMDSSSGLPEATAAFFADRFGWMLDPGLVMSAGDVMAGVMLVLEHLCDPGGVVVPVPSYPPFLAAIPLCQRELVTIPMLEPEDDTGYRLDLGRIDAALAAGARTVLLANPYNPLGRVFTRSELEDLRDVVLRHGARMISDEIHAPLVFDGRVHTPYATLDGTAEHVTTLVAASKAWNLPGLKCAQIVYGTPADRAVIQGLHHVVNHGVSPLGIVATVAAYTDGRAWLDGLLAALQARRDELGELLDTHLPQVHWSVPEATYLAWLDARALGLDDAAAVALGQAKVFVQGGGMFGAGYEGYVRLNFGTSAERLERIIKGLASAWS
jgi:cystathionine beta-lyase